jgi:DNA sulfur modification protein DndD
VADPMTVRRERLLSSLAGLFEQAVVAYRDKLKEDVQETASKLFRSMRTETDFFKLVINDHYGLRILDNHGNAVEDRSAGYEHLVALSLIGALQECSPISAPVVMDSPFGRLDPDHVNAVVAQLNLLATQVLLLVHEGELDRPTAHRELRGRLLAEFELERVSAYNTIIREVRAS